MVRASAPVLAVLAALLLPGCDRSGSGRPYAGVVLITIDSLRADHLGCYGYERDTSPRLDELAGRSVRFERAVVPTPRTTQSLASLMTGTAPVRHQLKRMEHRLYADHVTIAERFAAAGFRTAAFVSIPSFSSPQGFDKGFGEAFFLQPRTDVRAAELTDRALAWLAGNGDEPFFLWLHYRDPHVPYAPPEPYRDRFDPDYQGPLEEYFHFFPIDEQGKPADPRRGAYYRELKAQIKFGEQPLAEREVQRAIALYDGEIAYTDAQVGRLLDVLANRKNVLITVTADHGESLGEHDLWFDHGEDLFDPCLRVPLIIHVPDADPRTERGQVGSIDLAPTLLELCRLPPLTDIQGHSFGAALFGHPMGGRIYFGESGEPILWHHNLRFLPLFATGSRTDPTALEREVQSTFNRLRSISSNSRLKIIFDPLAADGARIRVFDLNADPGELIDVSGDPRFAREEGVAAKALRFVYRLESATPGEYGALPETGYLDSETIRILAEGGYVAR